MFGKTRKKSSARRPQATPEDARKAQREARRRAREKRLKDDRALYEVVVAYCFLDFFV